MHDNVLKCVGSRVAITDNIQDNLGPLLLVLVLVLVAQDEFRNSSSTSHLFILTVNIPTSGFKMSIYVYVMAVVIVFPQ